LLAEQLSALRDNRDEVVLGLDVFLARKLGVPGYEELAMGAVASGDVET
jgi:predicted phosphoribosyltransferase